MITSALLSSISGVRHGFGTASALVPEVLLEAWSLRPDKKQVHGTRLVDIVEPRQHAGHADGFHTRRPGLPVSVITADCVPLLLARRDGMHVAAVHAGWRGLYDGIIGKLLAEPGGGGEWVAAIGPTICAACYEVSEALADDFLGRFPALPPWRLVPQYRHLDLRAAAQHQLEQAGVTGIEHVGGCTCCGRDGGGRFLYRSYRRGDRNSQQHAGIMIAA